MASSRIRYSSVAIAIASCTWLGGCIAAIGNSSTGPAPMSVPPDGGTLRVPAGARLVSAGLFPVPSFDIPENSTLYIWDDDDKKVALVTTVGIEPGKGGRHVDLQEIPNVANALNNKHRYRVYSEPASAATTLPAPLGQ